MAVPTGWIACDYTDGDQLDDVEHSGEVRATSTEAIADQRAGHYQGIRWIGTDGYLYVEPPDEDCWER